jgi:ribosomal protein S18 acetylase RimI-like enzyme
MDFILRKMTDQDLPAVAEVEAGVFTDWYRIYRREPAPLAERTPTELSYATSLDPDGNFVAVAEDGALVGFILSRTWGSVGWFGTFGVPTQFHGLGIGTALVTSAVDYLSSRCSVVGLETMPESGPNIGLYSNMGFVPTYPTLVLELSLIHEAERFRGSLKDELRPWSGLGRLEKSKTLAGICEVSDALMPGLDFSREVKALSERGLGRTFVSRTSGGRIDGFAILRTAPFRREDNSGRAYIHALGLRPGVDAGPVLDDLLRQIWTAATALGLSRAAVGLNGRHQGALSLLKENGFRVVRAGIRMVRLPAGGDVFTPADTVELSRWAG